MSNTSRFYDWWTNRVKGPPISNEAFDIISNNLDAHLYAKIDTGIDPTKNQNICQ